MLSLVGVPGGAREMNVALPGSLMRADLPARTAHGIVHVEFVKDRSPDLDLPMMTYRLRMRRQDGDRHPPIAPYVLVLGDETTVPDRYYDVDAEAVFGWSVVRLAELDPVPLLGNPTTAAVAALGRGTQTERAAAFLAAAERIATTETVLRLTRTMLILRFGDAPGVEAIAEGLAGLPDEERLTRIAAAAGLTDLER